MCALTTTLMEGGILLNDIVEWLRTASAIVACPEYGHITGILFHPVECDLSGNMDAGLSGTSTFWLVDGDRNYMLIFRLVRDHPGFITASHSASGCTRQWTTLMENKREGREHPAAWGNFLTMASIL